MDVTEIVDETFETLDESTPVSKLRAAFEDSHRKVLLVTSDGTFEGIVTRRDVISSHEKGSRKAKSLVRPVPSIGRHEDLRETARLMIAGDTRVLPVLADGEDDGEPVGVVRADDLLRHVQPYLSVLDASDVASTDVVVMEPETTLGNALATFRKERIEHLPVVATEHSNDVVGILSLFDVLDFVTRELERSQGGDPSAHVTSQGGDHGGFGAREGESADLLGLPVRNVMVETVGTSAPDDSLDAVLQTMLEHGASSSVVLDDTETLVGIVTKTDLLESLTWTDEEQSSVQVFGTDVVTELSHEAMAERIDDVARKYRAMRVLEAKVHFNEHKEQLRGVPQIHVRIRLYTDKGLFAASDTGYGDRHAFSLTLNAIERQILEGKTHGQSKKRASDEEIGRMYGWFLSE